MSVKTANKLVPKFKKTAFLTFFLYLISYGLLYLSINSWKEEFIFENQKILFLAKELYNIKRKKKFIIMSLDEMKLK